MVNTFLKNIRISCLKFIDNQHLMIPLKPISLCIVCINILMFLLPTNAFVGNKNISVVKMHGATIKIIEAQQAKLRNNYKNTRLKLLKEVHLLVIRT